ncbi:MAG TPA: vitamin K epoxide reductase family protein [Anaerolineae bacterium]|nr:vitamin K epoxide reductase family protein [Caldilineae bacterium]HID35485.1 vitamin K epoxide reductase family protein [Anaerolineae bacterium]
MRRVSLIALLLLLAASALASTAVHAQSESVVRAVLFYSPTCPHCHTVIQEDLPPLVQKYGDQLQILLIDVSTEGGRELYLSAAQAIPIPEDKRGVPALVVGDTLLVGGVEIPARFPDIIEQGLASGGIDWPAIPGLDRVLKSLETQHEEKAAPEATPETAAEEASLNQVDVKAVSEMSIGERLALDPVGSAIAIVTLVIMAAMLAWALVYWARSGLSLTPGPGWINWAIPILSVIGAGVAFYLGFVEATGAQAVCGPVGDCNAVQQSEYAVLFGILPVGVAGFVGYFVILALWAWQRFGPEEKVGRTAWMLPFVIYFGTLFSAYLTFLEPFVIGAICMWCMTSAWIMTALLFLTFRWTIPRDA